MSATSPRRRTGSGRADVAGVLLVAGLLAALAAAATFAAPLLADDGLGSTLALAVLAGAGVLVLVVGVALLTVVRGRRRRAARTREALTWFDGLHVCTAVATRNAVRAEGKEVRSVERVLRMQVASLERALEGQDERLAEAVREEHRKTLLTIAALRSTLGHEPGEVALNRLEASLARLGAVPDFTRPALPEGRTGAPVVFLGAPQPLVPAARAATSTPTAPAAAAAPTTTAAVLEEDVTTSGVDHPTAPAAVPPAAVPPASAPTADLDAAAAAFDEPDPVDESRPGTAAEVAPSRPAVRPVPAPVRPAAPHRTRRRFRRATARV